MTYKTILIVFRHQEEAEALAKAAAILSDAHGAHVIGLYAVPQADVYPTVGFPITADITESYSKLRDSEADAIKTTFLAHSKNHDASWEWRYVKSEGAPLSRLIQSHAHAADLVVLAPPASDANFLEPDLIFEALLIGSGRPLLIVPNGFESASIGKSTIIAWNGTKEAARAAFDAAPVMQAAGSDTVSVLWLDPPQGEEDAQDALGTELSTTLARHGLKVSAKTAPISSGSAGEELLAQCTNQGADLLVMGGYGHTRIREFVLGGATDHILNHAGLPVLMSH